MPRISLFSLLILIVLTCSGQLDVPVRIELNGLQSGDRQISGLAFPATPDAAMSAEAVRSNSTTFTQVSGTSILSGDLNPPISSYAAGLVVQVVPLSANWSNAQLNLNSLGSRPIHKAGVMSLDSADLWPSVPTQMIYDGQNFIILGTVSIPCKAGFHVGGREYCIEDSSRSPLTFSNAAIACNDIGARLCKNSEWVYACRSEPSFFLLFSITNGWMMPRTA
ncbi:MAG: hypothetical protein IPF95_17055 [Flavobacteriales bacterium]|nr:hypothetical protein [Flavobacteriales bacterium]